MADGYTGYTGYGAPTSSADVKRRLAMAMVERGMAGNAKNGWEGANQAVQSIMGNMQLRQLAQQEQQAQAPLAGQVKALTDAMTNGTLYGTGNGAGTGVPTPIAPSAPAPAPAATAPLSAAPPSPTSAPGLIQPNLPGWGGGSPQGPRVGSLDAGAGLPASLTGGGMFDSAPRPPAPVPGSEYAYGPSGGPATVAPNVNTAGLTQAFADRAQDLQQDAGDAGINTRMISGYRDNGLQSQLYANYQARQAGQPLPFPAAGSGGMAAPAGQSYHNFGNAADIVASSPVAQAQLNTMAAEPWRGITPGATFGDTDHYQIAGPPNQGAPSAFAINSSVGVNTDRATLQRLDDEATARQNGNWLQQFNSGQGASPPASAGAPLDGSQFPNTPQGHDAFVRAYAAQRGISPDFAAAVAAGEGNNAVGWKSPNLASTSDIDPKTGKSYSFGDFQLNTRNGLGTLAVKNGIDPTDPSQWQASDKFAIDRMATAGVRDWSGDRGVKAWGYGANGNNGSWAAPSVNGAPAAYANAPAQAPASAAINAAAPAAPPAPPAQAPSQGFNFLSPSTWGPAAGSAVNNAQSALSSALAPQAPQAPNFDPNAGSGRNGHLPQAPISSANWGPASMASGSPAGGVLINPPPPPPQPSAALIPPPSSNVLPPSTNGGVQAGPNVMAGAPTSPQAMPQPGNGIAAPGPQNASNGFATPGAMQSGNGVAFNPLNNLASMFGMANPSAPQGANTQTPAAATGLDPQILYRVMSDPYSSPQARELAGNILQTYMGALAPHKLESVVDPRTGITYQVDSVTGRIRGALPTSKAPEFGVVNKDAMGVETYGWRDPVTQQITPYQPQGQATIPPYPGASPAAPAPQAQPQPDAPLPTASAPQPNAPSPPSPLNDTSIPKGPVVGESYLDSVLAKYPNNQSVQTAVGLARGYLRGDLPMPTGNAGEKPAEVMARQLVAQVPGFNPGIYAQRQKALTDYNDGTTPNSAGGMITNANAAVGHLSDLMDASEKLGKLQYSIPALNWAQGEAADHLGTNSALANARAAFDAAQTPFSGEITKFFTGSEGDAATREAYRNVIDANATVEQRRAAAQTLATMLQTKIGVLAQRYKSATGGQSAYPVELQQAQSQLAHIMSLGQPAPQTQGAPASPLQPGASTTINGVVIKRIN